MVRRTTGSVMKVSREDTAHGAVFTSINDMAKLTQKESGRDKMDYLFKGTIKGSVCLCSKYRRRDVEGVECR